MTRKLSFDLTDKDFLDLVALEVRGELDTHTSNELRKMENIDVFCEALTALKRSIETQLANKKSRMVRESYDLKYPERSSDEDIDALYKSYADWRAKAIRFLGAIELELAETKRQMKRVSRNEEYLNELIELIGEQMSQIDQEQYTEADQRVFEVASKIREQM